MKAKILLIDNYDSFTYNLAQYFLELNCEVIVYRNDQITLETANKLDFTHLVISPGPGTPSDSGMSMDFIKEFHDKKPILGVCLGHQCLGVFFGAKIIKIPVPKHGKISKIKHNSVGIFKGIESPFEATRYHSLVIEENSLDLTKVEITAKSLDDDYIMAIKSKIYNMVGLQFHPESIMTKYGHKLLENFII